MQGLCLVSEEGWKTINHYDSFPAPVRARLRHTRINICTYCAEELARMIADPFLPSDREWDEAISYMEHERYDIIESLHDRSRRLAAERAAEANLRPYPRTIGYNRPREEYFRQPTYKRVGWSSEDNDIGVALQGPTSATYTVARVQQADRDRDAEASA